MQRWTRVVTVSRYVTCSVTLFAPITPKSSAPDLVGEALANKLYIADLLDM